MRRQLKTALYTTTVTGFVVAVLIVPMVRADRFDDQIRALNQDTSVKQTQNSQLGAEATSLADTISKLQADINAMQNKIDANRKKIEELKIEIAKAEVELAKQRTILGGIIKSMYLDGDVSTLEMLASSKDLSEFFDKQQYKESVQNKVKATLDRVQQLKLDLSTQKATTEKIIAEQQILQNQIVAQRAENDRLLGLNQGQQDALNAQIKDNSAKASQLRSQQAAENAKFFQGNGSRVVAGSNGRDTYPNIWRNSPQDSMLDSWGMYNRECVSYTAWKVYETRGYMPYWGGRGNANQWDDNARAEGIPVDGSPRAGDIAIMNVGYYGHSMYVESVNPNGTINVSDYNYSYNGTYSEGYNISPAGLAFIHF
ncbi:hypothetical protein A3F37_03165 [Candidatus Saccharibacteria bacterium RIFCSPHIGHO2_12_FULL_41_12]|nr:MAG: hypothetical protein A3F37_03165 [Candidatus Saccharibacteria bacterium RIFCSPHIGHO2_12_FULL_41_12]